MSPPWFLFAKFARINCVTLTGTYSTGWSRATLACSEGTGLAGASPQRLYLNFNGIGLLGRWWGSFFNLSSLVVANVVCRVVVVVNQKGLSAEFLPKGSAEIRQKVFLHLFGLSVLLQKHFLLAECESFCRNCFFLQAESCFESSMVLHLSWNSDKFSFQHPILCIRGIPLSTSAPRGDGGFKN